MDAPWELVLHHDYRGVPGVIFDQSPGRHAHGRAINIAVPNDFQPNGETAGSGAIHLRGGDAAVHVDLDKPWRVLNGLYVRIVFSSDILKREGTLIDAGSFRVECFPTELGLTLRTTDQTAVVRRNTETIAPGGWASITVSYVQGRQLDVTGPGGGDINFQDHEWRGRLKPIAKLAIGNRLGGGHGVVGLIDDVQVGRLNPLWVDHNFRDRPVDTPVRHCWDDWARKIIELLNGNKECAAQIIDMLVKAHDSVMLDVRREQVFGRLADDAASYQDHWIAGELDQIPSEATALVQFLKTQGIDLKSNAALQALLTSQCLRDLIDRMPPMTCDPEFTGMLSAIAAEY
jgi:hypothetical protein